MKKSKIAKATSLAVLLMMSVCTFICSGISYADQWTKTYGGDNADYYGPIQLTSDGGYILAGYSASFGSRGYDIWILKLNEDGTIAWQKIYGGPGQDSIGSIQQTPDGGYIVTGVTWASGSDKYAAWILKLDPNGKIKWQKAYGSTGYEAPLVIQETSDKGYIVMGLTNSFGAGDRDVWVFKLDSEGKIQWEKTYGGTGSDLVISGQQTLDGGYIAAGYTTSFGAGKEDAWVLKLDSDGKIEWQKTYGGQEDDEAYSIQQTSDGGYIVVGLTYSFGAGNEDAWVLKLDSQGKIEWEKTYGGSNYERASSVQQTSDGGYIVAGDTDSFGIYGYDLWVLKLDSNGNLPGCSSMIGTSNATTMDTTVTEANSTAIVQTTHVSPKSSGATAIDTDATPVTQCQPAISFEPPSMDFSSVMVQDSFTQGVSIRSAGSEDLIIGTLSITGTDSSQFNVDLDNCSGHTLTPRYTCTFFVTFLPTSGGSKSASISIPSNDPDQGTVTVSLNGQGVPLSAIAPIKPDNAISFTPCSLYSLPLFSWNGTESFKNYEIQFSAEGNFGSKRVKVKTSATEVTIPSNTWKKILLIPGEAGGPVYWRVVGTKADRTQVTSDFRSIIIAPPQPVGDPEISPTIKGDLPILSWQNNYNTKFKVWLGNDEFGKKTSLSFSVKNPVDNGGTFAKPLTLSQWSSIRKLVGDVSGNPIFWYVESWDGLKRYARTGGMSFELTD